MKMANEIMCTLYLIARIFKYELKACVTHSSCGSVSKEQTNKMNEMMMWTLLCTFQNANEYRRFHSEIWSTYSSNPDFVKSMNALFHTWITFMAWDINKNFIFHVIPIKKIDYQLTFQNAKFWIQHTLFFFSAKNRCLNTI